MNITTSPPNRSGIDSALNYSHLGLVERLEDKLHLSPEDSEQLFVDMKKFLYLCSLSELPLAPSARIDEAWHHFILFTKDYSLFCREHFGRYLHHVPKTRAERAVASGASAARTECLAREVFGSDLSANWGFGVPKAESCNDQKCESCTSAPCGHGPPSTSCEHNG